MDPQRQQTQDIPYEERYMLVMQLYNTYCGNPLITSIDDKRVEKLDGIFDEECKELMKEYRRKIKYIISDELATYYHISNIQSFSSLLKFFQKHYNYATHGYVPLTPELRALLPNDFPNIQTICCETLCESLFKKHWIGEEQKGNLTNFDESDDEENDRESDDEENDRKSDDEENDRKSDDENEEKLIDKF